MAKVVLTDKSVASAKPPTAGRRNLWDAVVPSMALRITHKGQKTWVVQRRVNGRMLRRKLGDHPALKLSDARVKARLALAEMTQGRDPRQVIQKATASAKRPDSFEGAVEAYIAREVRKRRARTQEEIIRPLRQFFVPKWGSLALEEITSRDIRAAINKIVDSGKPVAANRTLSVLRRFFRWAMEEELVSSNPAAAIRKPTEEDTRERVIPPAELGEIWAATEPLGWPFGPMVRMLILTGQRRNEVAGMSWAEIDLDGEIWTIPASRTKNGREHAVPLSSAALGILAAAPRFQNEAKDKPVFTSAGKNPVSGFSRAKDRLDALISAAREKRSKKPEPMPPWRLHDLRRTAATGMGELGVEPHVIEAVLNHFSGFRSGVAGVYQRQLYLPERRKALEAWASHVIRLSRAPLRIVGGSSQ